MSPSSLPVPNSSYTSSTRTFAFDVQFWLGDNEYPLTACLRYYNGQDITFNEDRNVCVIFATIAQSTSTASTYGGSDWTEYDLIGDIQWANPRIYPMMVVSGQANDIDRTAATFKLSASQYVQQLGATGRLRTSVTIPNTGRYKKVKPLPFSEGANATVSGVLMGVERVPSKDSTDIQLPDCFRLELGNVTYFPRSSNYTRPTESTSATPKKRQGWRFQFDDTSPSSDKGKKRMRTDDE
ncbi:hypothetical protein OH76DRAFT_1525986 [Lentinus brumalis]|uniref:Uncharacterized protein n=1 Tax=Lentinus brumalis TaxID=2498619 RepID=A0A371D442_9APHY|nr:hypothetical protein OH76DRAFT_1525986 [Polyporus brumalis]